MRIVLPLVLLAVSALAAADDHPVNLSEAASVFGRVEQVMQSVLGIKAKPPAFSPGSGVAGRETILRHLAAIFEYVQPKFKFTARPLKSAPSVISFKDSHLKQMAVRLEVAGMIDRYGPLVTAKSQGLSLEEFGDAVGYFMARVAEYTHTPSTKFSPYLMPG